MSLRIICREDDCSMAVNAGGVVHTTMKTFIVDHPMLQLWLQQKDTYTQRQVVGVEVVEKPFVWSEKEQA